MMSFTHNTNNNNNSDSSANQPNAQDQNQVIKSAKIRGTTSTAYGILRDIPLSRIHELAQTKKLSQVVKDLNVSESKLRRHLRKYYDTNYRFLECSSVENAKEKFEYYDVPHPDLKSTQIIISLKDIHIAVLENGSINNAAEFLSTKYSTNIRNTTIRKLLKDEYSILEANDLLKSPEELIKKVGEDKYFEEKIVYLFNSSSIKKIVKQSTNQSQNQETVGSEKPVDELQTETEISSEDSSSEGEELQLEPVTTGYETQILSFDPKTIAYLSQNLGNEQQTSANESRVTGYEMQTIDTNVNENPEPNAILDIPDDETHLITTVSGLHKLMYGKKSITKAANELNLAEVDLRLTLKSKNIDNDDMLLFRAETTEKKLGDLYHQTIAIKRKKPRKRKKFPTSTEISDLQHDASTNNDADQTNLEDVNQTKSSKNKRQQRNIVIMTTSETDQRDTASELNVNTYNISTTETTFNVDHSMAEPELETRENTHNATTNTNQGEITNRTHFTTTIRNLHQLMSKEEGAFIGVAKKLSLSCEDLRNELKKRNIVPKEMIVLSTHSLANKYSTVFDQVITIRRNPPLYDSYHLTSNVDIPVNMSSQERSEEFEETQPNNNISQEEIREILSNNISQREVEDTLSSLNQSIVIREGNHDQYSLNNRLASDSFIESSVPNQPEAFSDDNPIIDSNSQTLHYVESLSLFNPYSHDATVNPIDEIDQTQAFEKPKM